MISENYVYKKEVDWSLLQEGLTLPIDNQIVFGRIMGRFLTRGESKDITLYLNGKSYKAKNTNVNFNPKLSWAERIELQKSHTVIIVCILNVRKDVGGLL